MPLKNNDHSSGEKKQEKKIVHGSSGAYRTRSQKFRRNRPHKFSRKRRNFTRTAFKLRCRVDIVGVVPPKHSSRRNSDFLLPFKPFPFTSSFPFPFKRSSWKSVFPRFTVHGSRFVKSRGSTFFTNSILCKTVKTNLCRVINSRGVPRVHVMQHMGTTLLYYRGA